MAGLNDFLTDTTSKATSLPSWYSNAQQQAVASATGSASQMPAMSQTLAGQAANTLAGPNNPFVTAGQTAQSIASGAANPWNTGADGQVTPNTNTAMGGLFQAQNQELNQLLPSQIAPAQAGAVGSGNFGSLRGQTAVDTAKGNAFADLYAKQMAAALQNQSTGAQAAGTAGNLANQNITNQTALGQMQQSDPLQQAAQLTKILGGINAPTTVTQSNQLSPLSQIGSVAGLLNATGGGIAGVSDLLSKLGSGSLGGGALQSVGQWFNNLGGDQTAGGTVSPDTGQAAQNATDYFGGTTYDPNAGWSI